MPVDWYILNADGQKAGPYSLDQLRSFWANGQVTLDTPYWREGLAEWQPIRTIENSLRPAPTVTPSTPTSTREFKMAGWQPASNLERTLAPAATLRPPATSPPASVQPATTAPRKGVGCGQGCLLLLVLVVAFIGFLSLLAPQSNAIQGVEVKDSSDAARSAGVSVGWKMGELDYSPGGRKLSDEETSSLARLALNATKLEKYNHDPNDRKGFILGFETGYSLGWDEAKRKQVDGD